jgi:ATP-dependent Clp protease ATP-binding subunit ClpA
MINLIKPGLSDIRRLFGAFLFVGPTGMGKFHLAQFLANLSALKNNPFRVLNCSSSEFSNISRKFL